jgi:hypothetical protein
VRDFNARELRTKNHETLHKNLKRNVKGQSAKLRQCYVYELRVDGVVRYIGKGFTINSANVSLSGKSDQLWNVIPASIQTPQEIQAYTERLQQNLNSRDRWVRYLSARTLEALVEANNTKLRRGHRGRYSG